MDELIGEGIMEIEPRKAIEHLKSMRDETLLLQKSDDEGRGASGGQAVLEGLITG